MSLPPYDESLVLATCEKTRALYREAGREPDDAYPVWPVRTQRDADAGLPYATSEQKHLAECREALGLPGPPVVPIAPFSVRGRFLYSGDVPFRWKAITAFALPALIAEGREAEARAWMAARHAEGFNLFRVLAMCAWLNLSPERGRLALSALCVIAEELGVALEVVALADTAAFGFTDRDCIDQVRQVGALVRSALPGTSLVQAANEHCHPTQIPWLHSVANVDYLVLQLPSGVIGTASAAQDDEALTPTGAYITRHLDRSRDLWNTCRRVRELENVSRETGRYVVNDEPMGAGEVEEPGRRYTDPAIAFTFGVLGRIFEVGSTFHCEAGLQCAELGPVQAACAAAFLHGATVIPEDRVLTFKNATWADSPVQAFDTTAAVRVYSGVQGDDGWTCALGLTGDPRIVWQGGWAPVANVAAYPGVTLWQIAHS
jgi:hypothetical protein